MSITIEIHNNKIIARDNINCIYFSQTNSRGGCMFYSFKIAVESRLRNNKNMSYNDLMHLSRRYNVGCCYYPARKLNV